MVGKRGCSRRSLSWSFDEPLSREIEEIPRTRPIHQSSRLYSHHPARILTRPHEILVCMPIAPREEDENGHGRKISRWYRLQVPAFLSKSDQIEVCLVWKGLSREDSSFAAIGSDLYCLGGLYLSNYYFFPPPIPDVLKLDTTSRTSDFVPVDNYMISPRTSPLTLVLDKKLFAFKGYYSYPGGPPLPTPVDGEMYDPETKKWEALPEPPFYMGCDLIYGTLENPSRILIARLVKREDAAMFYTYDVENRVWNGLGKRQVHPDCPIGWEGWGERAITVANTIYWVTRNSHLLAYSVDKDMWLEGSLRGLGISFLEGNELICLPGLVHLEGQLFGLVQSVSGEGLLLVIIDAAILRSSLQISVVAVHRCKMEAPTMVTDCLFVRDTSKGIEM